MKYLILYIASLALGGAGAWLVARWGSGFGLLDKANHRSSHKGVVPKGGGIGILAAFVFASLVLKIPGSFWLSATFLALISFYGDRFPISPKFRLPVQFIAALILLFPVLFSDSSSVLRPLFSGLCFLLLSIFIVGTANFYNFMDGINGIAGITGVVGFGLLGWLAAVEGADPRIITLSACLSFACLGFLPFNMPTKSRVFMGDAGSVLLGFVFAGMVVLLAESFLDFVCMAAFLFPFYADELTTMIVRIRDDSLRERMSSCGTDGCLRQGWLDDPIRGDGWMVRMIRMNFGRMGRLTRPHRRHLYQLLANEMEVAHWKISAGYGLLQLVVGIGALVFRAYGNLVVVAFLGSCFAGFAMISYIVRRRLVN